MYKYGEGVLPVVMKVLLNARSKIHLDHKFQLPSRFRNWKSSGKDENLNYLDTMFVTYSPDEVD